MRHSFRGGIAATAIAGTCVLAMTSTALARTDPGPTTSPEAIGVYVNGSGPLEFSVSNTPDQTTVGTTPVASVNLGPLVTASVLSATVVSNNYSYASVASLTTIIGAILGITSGTIQSFCVATGAGDFSHSYSTIEDLDINGATFTGNPTPNENLTVTLPAGLASLSVTLNQQVAGPVAGSETVNAINIQYTLLGGLTSEDIAIASSTCGPYTPGQVTPLASGKGFGIGLGALGLLGGGYATIRVRRRRNALADI